MYFKTSKKNKCTNKHSRNVLSFIKKKITIYMRVFVCVSVHIIYISLQILTRSKSIPDQK